MHHAYIYEGSQELLEALAESARKLFNFTDAHNPDVHVESFEKFGIDDSTALKNAVSFRSVSGRSLYIIGMGSITTEAQQALLKLFEEPPTGVIFVLLAPHGSLIATLRSRFLDFPIRLQDSTLGQGSPRSSPSLNRDVKKFLASPYKVRSALIATLLKDDEGARERVRDFLLSLESELYKKIGKGRAVKEGLEDIAKIRSYLSDRSPSLKMLLEHLAVSLPLF